MDLIPSLVFCIEHAKELHGGLEEALKEAHIKSMVGI